MYKAMISVILGTMMSITLYAEVVTESTNTRVDSIREAIDNFGKLEEKEISEVDKIKKMFKKGKASGQLKMMYASAPEVNEPYATAVGGIFKYELAPYHGFNLGAAAYISYDIPFMSGEESKRSSELSSSEGKYMDMGEVYLNYKRGSFNFRGGRQTLDTPLADTDDIRMIHNSFEAYVVKYEFAGIEFMGGNIQNWSGYDAGLDDEWVKTGTDGVNFGGIAYSDTFVFDAWYYNITGLTNASYFDLGVEYQLNKTVELHFMAQYLHESEVDSSGIEASIYGLLAEVIANNIDLRLVVNKADKFENKESFSGFGGGALFTSMDTTILDNITQDREAIAYVAGISYTYDSFDFLYAYGDFSGEANSIGEKAHIVEQNIGAGYNVNEEFIVGLIYATQEDLIDHANDWNRAQLMLSYNFK